MTFPFTLLLLIDACIMYKQTCIYFIQLSSLRVSPSSGFAGMVMSNILPLCSVQYVLLLNIKLSIYILHVCTHERTHARTHVRSHACTHARMYARTHVCTQVRTHTHTHTHTLMHVRTHIRTYAHTSLYASYFVSGIVLCRCVRYIIAIWLFVYGLFIHTNMCNNF